MASDANDNPRPAGQPEGEDQGLIGALRDDADVLDEIVRDAMRRRQISAWLPRDEDFETLEWVCAETGRSLNDLLDEALGAWLRPWRQRRENARRGGMGGSEGADCSRLLESILERVGQIPEGELNAWPHNPEGIDLEAVDANDPDVRLRLMEELGRRMSHLSERAYFAGWLSELEERVPALCEEAARTGKVQPFGGTVVCPGLAKRLLAMRDKLGHWVVPAVEGGYKPYVPPDK